MPHARDIQKNIPIYHGDDLRSLITGNEKSRLVMAEWNRNFATGSGIMVVKQGLTDPALIDAVTDCFNRIIAEEEADGTG